MDGTIKLSLQSADQTMLLKHLSMRRRTLFSSDGDCEALDAVLSRLTGSNCIELSWAEVFCVMRSLRAQRRGIMDDMHNLEDRRRFSNGPRLGGSWRLLDAEAMILDALLRRLWDLTC